MGSKQNRKPDFRLQPALKSGDPTAAVHSGEFWVPVTIKTLFVMMKTLTKNKGVVEPREVRSSTKT